MKKYVMILACLMILNMLSIVSAANELSTTSDRLNFFDVETHTFTVSNSGAEDTQVNYTLPSGWTWVSGSGCSNTASDIICTVTAGSSSTYTLTSPGSSAGEYQVYTFTPVVNNSYTGNDAKAVRVKDEEVLSMQIEYGRGITGNFFYNSMSGGKSQVSSAYIPNASSSGQYQLNFLHKIGSINKYLGVGGTIAKNLSLVCSYPTNDTLLNYHLVEEGCSDCVSKIDNRWRINYSISQAWKGWETTFYALTLFNTDNFNDGDNLVINCTEAKYTIPGLGDVVTSETATLTVVDNKPITLSATSDTTTIYNGTTEVEITYTLSNTEIYTLSGESDPIIVKIEAPENSQFIGVRGELWGSAESEYIWEMTQLDPSSSKTITLVAKFDTSGATATTLNLTSGALAEFVPPWVNGIGKDPILQNIGATGSITVNYGSSATVMNVKDEISNIKENVSAIKAETAQILTAATQINTTVNNIQTTMASNFSQIELNFAALNAALTGNFTNVLSAISSINNTPSLDGLNDSILNRIDQLDTKLQSNFSTVISSLNAIDSNMAANFSALFDEFNNQNANLASNFTEIYSRFSTLDSSVSGVSTQVTGVSNQVTSLDASMANNFTYLQSYLGSNFTYQQDLLTAIQSAQSGNFTEMISTLNSIQSSQDANFTAIFNRFDSVDGNLTMIEANLTTIAATVDYISEQTNCSGTPTDGSICAYLQDLNGSSASSQVSEVLAIVQYINSTRWGNQTANTLYNEIVDQGDRIINQLDTDITQVIEEITLNRNFMEEIPFLVVDSFNDAKQDVSDARQSLASGDVQGSQEKVSEAVKKIDEGNKQLQLAIKKLESQTPAPVEETSAVKRLLGWVVSLFWS